MTIFAGIVVVFSAVRLIIAFVNWQSPSSLESVSRANDDHLAILVPARNEEGQIPYLLSDLRGLPGQEIIVLDDHSTDGTKQVAEEYQTQLPGLRVIEGEELPEGWLGKPWACHQLAQATDADYLLYLDADVRINPEVIPKAVNVMKKKGLALLSFFPLQIMRSFGEKLVVPNIYYILVTLLPLPWIEKFQNPAISAANGQFMLFDGETYRHKAWHEQAHQSKVEDITIMQKLKAQGLRGAAEISTEYLHCRMYGGFRDAIEGFSKNFRTFFGESWILAVFFLVFAFLGIWLIIPFFEGLALACLAVEFLVLRPIVALTLGIGIFEMVILGPLQMVVTTYLAIVAFRKSLTRKHQWKGRPIG